MLAKFVALFDRLSAAVAGPIEEILGLVLAETGYQKQLQESEDEDDQQRLANIEELLTVARDFDERQGEAGQLEAFLEETCLVNDTDAWETDADRVTLMTLHASKGLEFPVVYLTAVEEGILPHERSREHPEQLEEERRLMFVGITRAQQELAAQHGPIPRFPRPAQADDPQFVSHGIAAERDGRGLGRRRGSDRASRGTRRRRRACDWVHDEPGEYVEDEEHEAVSTAPPRRMPRPISLTTAAAMANGGEPAAPLGARRLPPGHVGASRRLRLGPDHRPKRQRRQPQGDRRFFVARRPQKVPAGRKRIATRWGLNPPSTIFKPRDIQIMNRQEILDAIPHRDPFLLVDEVIECGETRIVGAKTFTGDEWFFAGHYPGYPLVPGVLLCEAATQCGAILLSHLLSAEDATAGKVPVLTRMNDVRFKRMVRPGEKIIMEVELVERLADALFMKAKVTVDGKVAVRFEFACTAAGQQDT